MNEKLEKLDRLCKKLGLKEYNLMLINEKLSVLYKDKVFEKAKDLKAYNELEEKKIKTQYHGKYR